MSSGGPQDIAEAQRRVLLEQLAYHQEQLSKNAESVRDIMQNIFWAFGVGILAATRWRDAIVIIPVFWTAWMLHAMQRTYDSTKHLAYARTLEEKLNALFDADTPGVLQWHLKLASQEVNPAPHINQLNFAYWGVLNIGSWIATVIYFAHLHKWELFGIDIGVFLLLYAIIGAYLWVNRNLLDDWQDALSHPGGQGA